MIYVWKAAARSIVQILSFKWDCLWITTVSLLPLNYSQETFFYFPTGQQLLQYDYNMTFMMRFPIVYVAVYCITVMFELVRDATYQKYEHTITHDSLTKALNRNGMDIEIQKTMIPV